jgi:hypothetical protein
LEDVTTPSGRRLLVELSFDSLQVGCSVGDPLIGVYVDGIPVPGTKHRLTAGTPEGVTVMGVSGAVAAGLHQLPLRMDCPSQSSAPPPSDDTFSCGAVLLGS